MRLSSVRADGQVARPPDGLQIAGGNLNLAIVEALPFIIHDIRQREPFDRLRANGDGDE
jgi:hypothetical protein